ncbi:hypothetical protein CEE37_00105 [candidate division LCP-89 bacterium B3_LCP]|uniref:Secretion system C-terminal sorting domain-containing protein n=1 Tax=candidate division LCP-89 bacterium B3_LCP TaxID=2012998 RepID=A0A532V4I0_UNCL8|nr:MAG: hypothetical protein CEE37_00105 [candidate division LCP-89 bacterium B3_LCP]
MIKRLLHVQFELKMRCLRLATSGVVLIVSVLLCLTINYPAYGQWGDGVYRVSESLQWGPFHDVQIVDNYAYCSMGYGLEIFNVSTPAQITLHSTFALPGITEGIHVSEGYAYLAGGTAGIQVLDVTDNSQPIFQGEKDTPGYAWECIKSGAHLYVADGSGGLQVVNVVSPSIPYIVGSLNEQELGGWARDLHIESSLLYLAAENGGLKIVSVATPSQPYVIGEGYNTDGTALGIAKVDTIVYLADGHEGVLIIGVSDPLHPNLISQWNTDGIARDIKVMDDYAYVADDENGLVILDVGDPEIPHEVANLDTTGIAVGLDIYATTLFLANDDQGLASIWIANPAAPVMLDTYSLIGSVSSVWVHEDIALAARGNTGQLTFLDVNDPYDPQFISEIDLSANVVDVYYDRSVCISAHEEDGVYFTDISTPSLPYELSHFDTDGEATGLAVRDTCLYVADGDGGLLVLNITDPEYPEYLADLPMSGQAKGIFFSNDTAYVSQWDAGVALVNTHQPNAPYLLVEYDTPGLARQCVSDGSYIYVADGYAGMTVLLEDLVVAQFDTSGSVWDIKIDGNTAFLAADDGGFYAIDVTYPFMLTYQASYRTPGVAKGLFLNGEDIYIADQFDLGIYRLGTASIKPGYSFQLPGSFELTAYPNPFNAVVSINVDIPFSEKTELNVYNVHGQRLDQLFLGRLDRGAHRFLWDAESYPSGVYMINVIAGKSATTRKVILQK